MFKTKQKQEKKIIPLQEGWDAILEKITLIQKFVEKRDYSSQRTIISRAEYIQVYTIAYDMCTQSEPNDFTEDLYKLYCGYYKNYLSNEVLPQLEKITDLRIIDEIVRRYDNHLTMNQWTSEFFLYLDRFYTRSKKGIQSLDDVCYSSFYLNLFKPLVATISSNVLYQIQILRDLFLKKENIYSMIELRKTFSSMIKLFIDMGSTHFYCFEHKNIDPDCLFLYKDYIEKKFLESSETFYSNVADKNNSDLDIKSYLSSFEDLFHFEKECIFSLLDHSTTEKHQKIILESFFETVCDNLLNNPKTSVLELFNRDDQECWKILSQLFNWLNKLEKQDSVIKMSIIYKNFLLKTIQYPVQQIVADIESKKIEKDFDKKMITTIYDFYKKYSIYCYLYFDSSIEFKKKLEEVMKHLMNNESFKFIEYLASYIDKLLKKMDNNISEYGYEEYLKDLIRFMNFIVNKDVFFEHYRSYLSNRLLNRISISKDYEKTMISEMKIMNGFMFTSKLEGMMIDIQVNSSVIDKFYDQIGSDNHLHIQFGNKIDFQPMILSSAHWSKPREATIKYPQEIKKWMDHFEQFYLSTNSNKKLKWLPCVGTALVSFYLSGKTFDLQVDLLQATILNAFANRSSIELDELVEQTGLEKDLCKRVVFSLSGKQALILIRNEDGTISINSGFKSPIRRIKIPSVPFPSDVDVKKVKEDRLFIIDASIVRIMKARKTLSHQELISNVMSQLIIFKPESKDIKKQIESLIDRDFLERSKDSPNCYNYLA